MVFLIKMKISRENLKTFTWGSLALSFIIFLALVSKNKADKLKNEQVPSPTLIKYEVFCSSYREQYRFDEFPINNIYSGAIAPINLASNPKANTFRTRLSEDTKEKGVNFAGHYSVTTIGCGSTCQMLFLVDAKNGKVYNPPLLVDGELAIERDSNLLVINPANFMRSECVLSNPIAYEPNIATKYYVWENNVLYEITNSAEKSDIKHYEKISEYYVGDIYYTAVLVDIVDAVYQFRGVNGQVMVRDIKAGDLKVRIPFYVKKWLNEDDQEKFARYIEINKDTIFLIRGEFSKDGELIIHEIMSNDNL